MNTIFKKQLHDLLDYHDMTVKELSAKAGIPKPTLEGYLGMRTSMPPADVAVKIATVFKVSVEYLVTGKMYIKSSDITPYLKFRKLLDKLSLLRGDSMILIETLVNTATELELKKNTKQENQ
jgi:transcriptional regulator with XRE-family HTH domain